jgi:hypothetical protein
MTKLELIREIENNYKNSISVERSLDAVDKYSSALLRQTDVVGSGDGFPDEDDEDYYQPEPECQICGKVDGHHRGCPEDDSPFALLERRGFD